MEAIRSWPTPTTIKELKRCIGFSNFYRRFINNYSTVTSLLTNVLKGRPTSLSWTPMVTAAIKKFQQAFISAALLINPEHDKPFIVEVDASTLGIDAILSQKQGTPPRFHPCSFFSKKLPPVEQNYDIRKRELLVIKVALEEWRPWWEGARHPFVMFMDQQNFAYL